MASWEAAALKLQSHVAVTSDPNSLDKDKCLPPLPLQHKSTVTTKIEAVASEEGSNSTKGWKPLSLSTPILLAVIALTLLLAAAVETIAQRSAAQGGLALSPTLDDLPGYAKFSYLYVPNIIAVLYSIIWSWIDLDVKRMQPWFELSKPHGAAAENSLFLDYQHDFVAFVPFRAAKRRHWPVFFGGTAMVVVFWLLTPLQSALLGTDVVSQTKLASISTRSQIIPLADQVTLLDPEVLNTGYAIGWLGRPFPPFTMSEYALLPFYVKDSPAPTKVEANWTAETTKLSTELDCWPAQVEKNGPRNKLAWDFLNGQGCNATIWFNAFTNYSMYYIGYHSSAYSDHWLGGRECPKTGNNTHQFLALWATPIKVPGEESPDFNITALYCQPTYYKQRVLARIKSSTLEPDPKFVQDLAPREVLTAEEFNSTAFEFILANGMAARPIVKDFPYNLVVEQQPRLNFTGITRPASNMVGFALAGRDNLAPDYSSPTVLHDVYRHAHQYLFSTAVNRLLTNETRMANQTVSVEFSLTGVVVSRVFATAVEVVLVFVACFTAVVLGFCRRAPSKLPTNPSSIRRHIDLFRNSPELLHSFRSMDSADEKTLLETFQKDQFRMERQTKTKETCICIDRVSEDSTDSLEEKKITPQKGFYDPVRPLVLKREIGALFVLPLVAAIIVLSYLKQQEQKLNGLHRPSESFEVLQLLENYIPTIFATLIEPLWVLLNRLLCVLQPFKDLWEGKAMSSHSIDVTYTSIPPQLVLFRALKSKHLTLVVVCAMALLANVLAVGLGSLFNEGPMIASYPQIIHPAFAPKFDNNSVSGFGRFLTSNLVISTQYQDHLYIAMANMTSGTTLPPWVSQEYFFQRYTFEESKESQPEDTYNLQTRGFGARGNCTPVPARNVPIFKDDVNQTRLDEARDESSCGSPVDWASRDMRESTTNRSTERSAIEFCGTINSSAGANPCGRSLVLGWGRTPKAEDINGTIEGSFMVCRPVFETAMFNLTVDKAGRVLSYNRVSGIESTLDYPDSENHTETLFQNVNHHWNSQTASWHNDTTTRDWMNYLMMIRLSSRSVVDPTAPLPDPKKLIGTVEDIYRRLYAIMLSLNEQLFESASDKKTVTGTRYTKETRIFMEQASFIITMTVLSLNTAAALLFYTRAVAFVLPRMPTTVGSILAYVASSRLVTPAYRVAPGQSSRTLSFGRYIGLDGNVHIGVDMDPHVTPVNPSSLRAKTGFLRRWRRKRWGQEDQSVKDGTWL